MESVVVVGLEVVKLFIVVLCIVQQEFVDVVGKLGKLIVDFLVFFDYGEDVYYLVFLVVIDELVVVLIIGGKVECDQCIDEIKIQVVQWFVDIYEGCEKEVGVVLCVLIKKLVWQCIFIDYFCIDGCGIIDICVLLVEVVVVLCVYGSVLFECGEIQILGVIIFDMIKMVQQIDLLGLEILKWYMYYYNFLLFFIGEIGWVGLFKWCEIGYGVLVEWVLVLVLLSVEEFLYVICQVLEVLGFNGLILMGLVCVLMLVLFNVGVLFKVLVVGIVMGLVFDDI